AVEAGLVGEVVLVEIALVVALGDLRREERVRKGQAERRVLVALRVRVLVVRHLAEVVELHVRPSRGSPAPGSRRRPAARSGASDRSARGRAASRWAAGAGTARRRSPGRSGPRAPRRSGPGSSRA